MDVVSDAPPASAKLELCFHALLQGAVSRIYGSSRTKQPMLLLVAVSFVNRGMDTDSRLTGDDIRCPSIATRRCEAQVSSLRLRRREPKKIMVGNANSANAIANKFFICCHPPHSHPGFWSRLM
jgi:hypothetical protein